MKNPNTPKKTSKYVISKDDIPTPTIPNRSFHSKPEVSWGLINTSKFVSNRNLQTGTPISAKIENENYKKNKIFHSPGALEKLKIIYSQCVQQQFDMFLIELRKKHHQSIKQFSPKCSNFDNRVNQMLSFFASIFMEIYEANTQEKWIKDQTIFTSVACLSAQLFTYIQNSTNSEYKRHRDIFQINIKSCVQPLQLFLNYLKYIPQNLKNYLKGVQKRVIIEEIWQNQEGFKILTLTQSQILESSPHSLSIKKMMQLILKHSRRRIRDICNLTVMKPAIIDKITNILQFIFRQKFYLLKNNNLDQIILCCIMSCLSINQKQGQQTLEKLFKKYNSCIEYSYNSHQFGLKNQNGEQMQIVEYYNEVFLVEIQHMIDSDDENSKDIFQKPVRLMMKNPEVNPLDFKQPRLMKRNSENLGRTEKTKYLQQIFKQYENQMKEQNGQDGDDDYDIPSPQILRHYSNGHRCLDQ